MNHIIQANVAGLALTFDEDAYALLDDYLARLNGYFQGSPGHAEVMSDIEARLAELFTQALRGRQIVNLADVQAATATLGQPEAFADAAAPEAHHANTAYANPTVNAHPQAPPLPVTHRRPYKRLMRDPEDKVISGVCGGLAAYFGIDEPLYVRLAFAVAFFGAGIGLLPYLILWMVMPQARNGADRLAMRGEPINVDSLSAQVEREVARFGSTVRELGDEVHEKGVTRANWRKAFHRYSDEGYVG